MAIEIFTGSVGSGKSYHALCRGLEMCRNRKKNTVVANFPIRARTEKEEKNWIYLEEFEPEDLIKISFQRGLYGVEGSGLIIIDEAGSWFNSRDWQIDGQRRKEWIKFFSQSRKFGYDVILIAQDVRMIDRQIRSLAEYHVKHVKLRNYKWLKWIPVPLFAYVYFWQGGSFRGNVSITMFKPWIAKRYDTMKLFKISDEVQELAKEYGVDLKREERKQAEKGGTAFGGGFPFRLFPRVMGLRKRQKTVKTGDVHH